MSLADATATAPDKASSQASSTRRPAIGGFAKLRLHVSNIYRLIIKELYGVRADPVMLALVAYSFTIAIYAIATGAKVEATNLSVGIVDEDRSDLSRQIRYSLAPPTFKPAVEISANEIDPAMNSQRFLFVIEIPPKFESNILAGRQASAQIDIDATAVGQAFNGMSYIQNVIQTEVMDFVTRREGLQGPPITFVTRAKFNPNFISSWFTSVMGVINNLTMLTIILTGAALIREREQGTVEHLLVMPVVPIEIMASKIIANGIVILIATALSLAVVVEGWLQVPVAGSRLLFIGGSSLYVFTVAALGILLGTIASTMGQFGLLCIPVLLVMMLLSGSSTPMESMPVWLQYIMNVISPTPHFVVFAQDVLYRGAGFSIVWQEIVAMTAIGAAYFGFALYRFRRVIFSG